MASELALKFFELFRGLDRAHGRYVPKAARGAGQKVDGSASTIRSPITPELWDAHLSGDYGLGVVPIREDNSACWGAIDIDVYDNLDHQRIAQDVARYGLPLIVCKTKSGGAHLYLFVSEPVPAQLVRERLMEWAVILGCAGVEVFPKQIQLSDNENDLGNWINIPYFGGTRLAVMADGRELSAADFVSAVEAMKVTGEQLADIQPEIADEKVSTLLADGPPCLQALAIHGFPQGTRNNAMFNLGVYLRKRYPDNWADFLSDYNEKLMSPALTHKEIVTIRKSLNKKSYNYKCKDQPICQACSRQICLTRKFGVGDDEDDPGVVFGELVQVLTEPEVSYIWDVDGIRVEFPSAKHILDQRLFQIVVMDKVKKLPNYITEKTWRGIIRDKLAKAEIVTPPKDATPSGQLYEHLITFLNQAVQARQIDELLMGRPYTNGQASYFRIRDFIDHLKRFRIPVSEKQLYNWLNHLGAKPIQDRLKGQQIRYWAVSAVERQTEEFETPVAPKQMELDS